MLLFPLTNPGKFYYTYVYHVVRWIFNHLTWDITSLDFYLYVYNGLQIGWPSRAVLYDVEGRIARRIDPSL